MGSSSAARVVREKVMDRGSAVPRSAAAMLTAPSASRVLIA